VQSRVVLAVDGTYDFYWRVFNDPTSAGPIGFLRTGNISTSSYNANYRIDGLGNLAPQTAFLFASPTPGFIKFAFYDVNNPQATQALAPGQSSLFIFLDTNATNFAQTAFLDVATIGTFQSSNVISTFGRTPDSRRLQPATLMRPSAFWKAARIFGLSLPTSTCRGAWMA
jgi:hypothetical protein